MFYNKRKRKSKLKISPLNGLKEIKGNENNQTRCCSGTFFQNVENFSASISRKVNGDPARRGELQIQPCCGRSECESMFPLN